MTIVSAIRATIKLGEAFQTEGLMSENEDYAIAVTQFCDLISFDKTQASRDFKVLLRNEKSIRQDVDFQKWKTPLHSQPVNVLSITQAEKLLFRLSLKGHQPAIDLSEALIGLSLHQLFSDAFKIKVTPEERQQYLDKRWLESRSYSESMHPWFQQHCIANHYPAAKVHDLMTVFIFGQTAEQARQKPMVFDNLDPTIGLNHQENSDGQETLAKVKRKFCLLKAGSWEDKVKRAVDFVIAS